MKTFTHYGIQVVRQVTDISFKSTLRKAGYEYIELAIAPEIDVVKYKKNEEERYAFICPIDGMGDYGEVVYITSKTPDDCNWNLLQLDVEGQVNGKEPMERKTRVMMLLELAEKNACKIMGLEDEKNNKNIDFSYLPDIAYKEELMKLIKRYLAINDVDPQDMMIMEHYDVSEEFLEELMER